MSKEPPLLIELFGQPGAGKTTLARAAAEGSSVITTAELAAAWHRLPIRRKAAYFGRALLDGRCLAHAIQLATTLPLLRRDCLRRFARVLIRSHWIRSQQGLLLLEEGCLQDLWSIFYSAGQLDPDPRQLAPLIGCLYGRQNAAIVFLEVDPLTAFDRIRSRTGGKSRLDRLSGKDLRLRLNETAQLPYKLAEAAELAGLKVHQVAASQSIEASVGQLRAMMQQFDRRQSSSE